MHSKGFRYPESEDVFQWIWEQVLFDTSDLKTIDGKPLIILNKGVRNSSDGPDFLQATIQIGNLVWSGAIEIHLSAVSWKQHAHHLDSNFNQVILHVVLDDNPQQVYCHDGSSPFTLNLLPYLPIEFKQLVKNIYSSALPCAGQIPFISKEAFNQQIEKAHLEYLEKKSDDVLSFYNPSLEPSIAWKQALILALFDGFGVVNNRNQMVEVGRFVLESHAYEKELLIKKAIDFAGFGNQASSLKWNHKGVFPASHPRLRIPQAVKLTRQILESSLSELLTNPSREIWKQWIQRAELNEGYKSRVLYSTVFIPALHVLGTLFASQKVLNFVLREWNSIHTSLPKSTQHFFREILEPHEDPRFIKLGLIHQQRAYCSSLNCHRCIVLKKAISS